MKHHCIFEITQPNIHSELYKASFVQDYGEDYTAADEMCQSMNNFKPKDKFVHFLLRCLEQEEFDAVQDFLKTNPHGDVSEVYSPVHPKDSDNRNDGELIMKQCQRRCGNCDWYDLTVPTTVVRKERIEKGYKCSITGRGMFKDNGKKCKNHTFRSDHFCEQKA